MGANAGTDCSCTPISECLRCRGLERLVYLRTYENTLRDLPLDRPGRDHLASHIAYSALLRLIDNGVLYPGQGTPGR